MIQQDVLGLFRLPCIVFLKNKKTTDANPIIPHPGINLARELTIARMID